MKTMFKSLFLMPFIPLLSGLLSFSDPAKPGSDVYEIYLNKQLVVREAVRDHNELKTIALTQSPTDQLVVKYSHCGQLGKSRTISLINGQRQVIKKWKFSDAGAAMPLQAKEVPELKADTKAQLVYASQELSEGIALAYLEKR